MSVGDLDSVRAYFDELTPTIIDGYGHTYQAATLVRHSGDPFRDTTLFLAERAGIQPGMRVLDAGCGAGGPAVDIAQHVEGVTIGAITISAVQATAARKYVESQGLGDRIDVHLGDYHRLPFDDDSFDVIYFFESASYSADQEALFTEAMRVIRPGGTLYVKDFFAHEKKSRTAELDAALDAMNRLFACNVSPISATVAAMSAAGFSDVSTGDHALFDTREWFKGMVKPDGAERTDLGEAHRYSEIGTTPMYCAEVRAKCPARK